MIDGKMASLLQGDSGAPCHYCHCTKSEHNNTVCILQGFTITKNYDSCMEIWQNIAVGDIDWSNPERAGQCHKPLVSIMNFSILHWKLRSFDFVLNVYYRLIAGVHIWVESDKQQLAFVNAAKGQARDFIRARLGMLIDTPTSEGGYTNNGVLAERFFLN